MRPRTAFELVKKANPVDAVHLADSATEFFSPEQFERIIAQPYRVSTARRDRHPRLRVILVPAGALSAVVVLVAAAWFLFQGGEQAPPASSVIGGSTAAIATTSTSQTGGIIPSGDHAMTLTRDAFLLNQSAVAEVIIWGEVAAVELPGSTEQTDQTTTEGGEQRGLPRIYSIYLVVPHEVWKGEVAADTPLALLAESGVAADGGAVEPNRPALPTLHIGDQVVMLAARRPEYGPQTATDYWLLHGGRSVFKAESDSVFSRLDPVPDDPSGNAGSLLWLRRLLEDG